jgi:quercetin dioxygenase-like cupin family protein
MTTGEPAPAPAPAPGLAGAPDLTERDPRPLDAELDGYAWLPRMFDKARATAAGVNGSYLFGCPVDHTCMARLGITPELVLETVARHDDAGALAALRAHGIPAAADAWFDAVAVEDELAADGPYLHVRRGAELPPDPAGGRVFAGADHGATVSVVVIDAPPGTAQDPHTHPTEEVVAVTGGQATFMLGERQARIVRAGEVVRISAGAVHRFRVTGVQPLQAVAVHAASAIVTDPAR